MRLMHYNVVNSILFNTEVWHNLKMSQIEKLEKIDESDECCLTSSNIELTTYTSLLSRTCSKEQFRSIYSRLTTKSSVVTLKSTTCCISQVSCFLIGCRLLHPSRGSSSSVQLAAEATSVRLVAEATHPSGLQQQPCGSVFS